MVNLINIISNFVYYSAVGSGILAASAGGFLYVTKPTDDSLRRHLKTTIIDNKFQDINDKMLGYIKTLVIDGTSEIDIKDFVFFKYARIDVIGEKKINLVGALQSWHQVDM